MSQTDLLNWLQNPLMLYIMYAMYFQQKAVSRNWILSTILITSFEKDFKLILSVLQEQEVFISKASRHHNSFKKLKPLFDQLKYDKILKWIKHILLMNFQIKNIYKHYSCSSLYLQHIDYLLSLQRHFDAQISQHFHISNTDQKMAGKISFDL